MTTTWIIAPFIFLSALVTLGMWYWAVQSAAAEKAAETKPAGTETEAEKKTREEAAKKAAADKEKGFLATCRRALKWFAIKAAWLLLIAAVLYGIYYAVDKHKWSNGMTLVQASIASSPAPASPPEVWRYTEQEAASGKLIWRTDSVKILDRVRGQEPRFMFIVPSPYEGRTSYSRYDWRQRLPEGVLENLERGLHLKFVGNFISDTLFTGSYTVDGETYTFRLEHVR